MVKCFVTRDKPIQLFSLSKCLYILNTYSLFSKHGHYIIWSQALCYSEVWTHKPLSLVSGLTGASLKRGQSSESYPRR